MILPQPTRHDPLRRFLARRRGMALLLVMIGLVVCTILTAGFLSTQGTSIGIARNERDASKCHAIAQTGVDMCYWLIRNKPDWRETMTPGTWLNNVPIGEGTVTVSVADGDNTGNFADDTTEPVTVTATGTYDSRNFTLTATIRPTGGGTVFANGNFISGNISVGTNDLLSASTIDSYNSSVASYNPLLPGSNAAFLSNAVAHNSLLVYFPSVFRGSYTAGPGGLLSNIIGLVGLVLGPSSTGTASEPRNPGTVVFPNTAGLLYRGNLTHTAPGTTPCNTPGTFDSITISNGTINIAASGIYNITGNVTIGNTGTCVLNINDGISAVIVVKGNLTIQAGKISLSTATSQLALYVQGNVTLSGGSINNNGVTSRVTLFGGSGGGQIQISNAGGTMYGSIYAPQHDMTMSSSSPKFYGAVVAQSLTLKNSAALHFDEALRALYIGNVTGGSAAPGTADYRISILGGPGIQH